MSAGDLLRRVVPVLDSFGIEHMVAGSFASTYHGEPRTTQDIDIVIHGSRDSVAQFVGSLDQDAYYCDLDAALDAFDRRTQFNLIDMATGWKIDFVIRKSRAFSVSEFRRRTPAEFLGASVFMATAEDTIIAKLDWARDTGSERQLLDVASILAVSGPSLDLTYVERWVEDLELAELWRRAQNL